MIVKEKESDYEKKGLKHLPGQHDQFTHGRGGGGYEGPKEGKSVKTLEEGSAG